MQHDLRDLSLNTASQVALGSGMDEAATKIKQPENLSLPDVGYDMTTESLPKEQLAEPQDEAYSLQQFPDLDMDLIWEALMVEECNAGNNKDEPVEESLVEDVGYAINTKSKSSNILTIKSLCQEIVEIKGDTLLLDHSHQLPVGEDAIHQEGLVFGAEKENSSISVINKTCTEETSERKKSEKVISYEILSEHFGKPLADAAESFHVSRSTFKRMCRDHGITRWQSSRRSMGSHNSSKHRTVNDDELSMNSSLMFLPPLQDTADVTLPETSQDMNKINVKDL